MQGHLAGPKFPSPEAGSSIVDVDVDGVGVSMEGPFEKIGEETQVVSHDIVVRVLVPFLLLARLRKMEKDNRRSCRGLQRLLSGGFGISEELLTIITITYPHLAWIVYGVCGGCSQLFYHWLNTLCMHVRCIRSSS